VIHAYHPSPRYYFLPVDELIPAYDCVSDEETDSEMDVEEDEVGRKLVDTRRMDESFSLVSYLTGINLPSETYWTDYVMERYYDE